MGDTDVLVIKGQINFDVLENVKKLVLNNQKSSELYLVLDTYGGNASVGFRIMRLLNIRYKKIAVVIPNWAMSTGTLMSLGGDIIYMFYSSSLGPLDLQIESPNDGSGISTLDVRDSWSTLLTLSNVIASSTFDKAINKYDLPKEKAAKVANEFSINFIKPILDKIDPYHLQSSYRSSEVGAKYATALLKQRMLRLSPSHAERVGKRLSDSYETHGTAITLEEARDELGLTVEDISDLSEWSDIEPIYNLATDGVVLKYINRPKPKTQKATKKEGEA